MNLSADAMDHVTRDTSRVAPETKTKPRESPVDAGFACTATKANAKQTIQESTRSGGREEKLSPEVRRRGVVKISESEVQRDRGPRVSSRRGSQAIRPDGSRHRSTSARQRQDGEGARVREG